MVWGAGGGGPLGPRIPPRRREVGGPKVFDFWVEKNLWPMFPYRVKYTESESDIQNYNLLLKTPKMPKYFRTFGGKIHFYFVLCINCIIHILFFGLFFAICVFLGFLDFHIYIYYTCRSFTRVGLLHVRPLSPSLPKSHPNNLPKV